ncbi:MAG: hypothetical protein IJ809_02865 [Clostridia bacterium]|nr:hypothetical protein [Clostridia bacterium]
MNTITYLQLCRYINAIKSAKKSKQKTELLINLTSLVSWSVEHEEIDYIPISEELLDEVLMYVTSYNLEEKVKTQRFERSKLIVSYLLSGNIPYNAFNSFVEITAIYSGKTEEELRKDIKSVFDENTIVSLAETIVKQVYPEYKKVETEVFEYEKKVVVKFYNNSLFSPCSIYCEKIKEGLKNITGYKAEVDYDLI